MDYRQILNKFAVTAAFGAGALITALVLDIHAVQAYLGIAMIPVQDLLRVDLVYVGIAMAAGMVVDGLRLVAARFWRRSRQLEHDIVDIFRSSLA